MFSFSQDWLTIAKNRIMNSITCSRRENWTHELYIIECVNSWALKSMRECRNMNRISIHIHASNLHSISLELFSKTKSERWHWSLKIFTSRIRSVSKHILYKKEAKTKAIDDKGIFNILSTVKVFHMCLKCSYHFNCVREKEISILTHVLLLPLRWHTLRDDKYFFFRMWISR